jgi:hypothetical protein
MLGLGTVVVLGVIALLAQQAPELWRYLKTEAM